MPSNKPWEAALPTVEAVVARTDRMRPERALRHRVMIALSRLSAMFFARGADNIALQFHRLDRGDRDRDETN